MPVDSLAGGTPDPTRKSHDRNILTFLRRWRQDETADAEGSLKPRLMQIRSSHRPSIYTRDHERLVFHRDDRAYTVGGDQLTSTDLPLHMYFSYLTK
jgi:hypothetical protein